MLSDIFHKGEKGFKLVARRPEARPFLTSRGGGKEAREEHTPRKSRRKKQEKGGASVNTCHLFLSARNRHRPSFQGEARPSFPKYGTWSTTERRSRLSRSQGPSLLCVTAARFRGGIKSRYSGLSAPTFHSPPWKDVKDYLCYLSGKSRDILLKDEWKMSTKN